MPPTVPIHHYSHLQTNKIRRESYSIIPCCSIQAIACFEHSNFLKVNRDIAVPLMKTDRKEHCCSPHQSPLHQTTSVLTATTLIYAIGAGITAAAGTRLALQSLLVKGFKLYSFQLRRHTPPHCYLLSLPRRVGIG